MNRIPSSLHRLTTSITYIWQPRAVGHMGVPPPCWYRENNSCLSLWQSKRSIYSSSISQAPQSPDVSTESSETVNEEVSEQLKAKKLESLQADISVLMKHHWKLDTQGAAIEKTFRFKNFSKTMVRGCPSLVTNRLLRKRPITC